MTVLLLLLLLSDEHALTQLHIYLVVIIIIVILTFEIQDIWRPQGWSCRDMGQHGTNPGRMATLQTTCKHNASGSTGLKSSGCADKC